MAQLAEAGPRMLRLTGAQIAAVTLDVDGGLVFELGTALPPLRAASAPLAGCRSGGYVCQRAGPGPGRPAPTPPPPSLPRPPPA